MTSEGQQAWMDRIDPELRPFIPLFPPADLSDPVIARKGLAELAAAAPAPDVVSAATRLSPLTDGPCSWRPRRHAVATMSARAIATVPRAGSRRPGRSP